MKHWGFYRLALPMVPCRAKVNASDFPQNDTKKIAAILRRYRCMGATLCTFDAKGVTHTLAYGAARKDGLLTDGQTVYRAASVSKLAAGLLAMKMAEEGLVSLDEDVNAFLPFSLRHPAAPQTPLTLRMLLSHTAGIHDGDAYNHGIAQGALLSDILAKDSFCTHLPGTAWEYSNLGAGIAGAVLEAAAKRDLETLFQEKLFAPLGMTATFYPQKVQGVLADAWRVLPPAQAPNFDARKRQARPMPSPGVDAQRHYALAHGNLCLSAPQLAKLGRAAMQPGFLTAAALEDMRRVIAPFGARARNLSQGMGTFILTEPSLCSRRLYGHQGMAYGAVHGLFFDPDRGRGVALLTSAAGEARQGVLADLNKALLSLLLGDHHG